MVTVMALSAVPVTARRPVSVTVNGHLLQRCQRRVNSKTRHRPPPPAILRKVPVSNTEYRCASSPLWDGSKRNGNPDRGTAVLSASEPGHVLKAIIR